MLQPNQTITEADQQRIRINKARAIQQRKNKEIARTLAAIRVDQMKVGMAWPKPKPIVQVQDTLQAKRKRAEAIQAEYDDWIVATAPRKRLAPAPTANSALQSQLRNTILPTEPM